MELLRICVLCLLLGIALGADVGALLKQGDDAFASSQFTAAVRAYTQAIELDSKSALLYTKRAAAYISMRQQAQALRDLNKAVELDAGHTQGWVNRGRLHRQMCSFAQAERDLTQVLGMKPDHKTALKEMEALRTATAALADVKARAGAGDVQGARASLATLYSSAPDCVEAQLLEAQLWAAQKDWEQAAAATGRLLKSEPGHTEALVLRGTAYYYLFDHDMAKRHFGEALKFDPDHGEARKQFNRVKLWERKLKAAERAAEANDWAAAEHAYIEGLNVDAEHYRANVGLWLGLARSRLHQGKGREAAEAARAVQNMERGHREAMAIEIKGLLAAEAWQDAVNRAREAVNEAQDSHELRGLLHEAEKRLKMSLRKDYYKILGIEKHAGDREVKKAYRDLAKVYHPDKVTGSEEDKKAAEDKFKEVAEAYEVLSDSEKRARYDNGEDLADMQQGGGGGHHFHQGGQQFTFHFNM